LLYYSSYIRIWLILIPLTRYTDLCVELTNVGFTQKQSAQWKKKNKKKKPQNTTQPETGKL